MVVLFSSQVMIVAYCGIMFFSQVIVAYGGILFSPKVIIVVYVGIVFSSSDDSSLWWNGFLLK